MINVYVTVNMYSSRVRSSMLHGSETWPVRKENEVALQRAQMRMVRWMCNVKVKDRVPSKELKMICNDFLVVKVNCWSYVFNIMKYM